MKRIISLALTVAVCITCITLTAMAKRDYTNEEALANELKELGIFNGVSETSFDLERAPSRIEAVVMLVRVLGKEAEALSTESEHPFTDVPDWANKYIGYAYENGLANGQALTEFGTGEANAAMYLTFVLRALGYSDTKGADFVWNDPFQLARETGILTSHVDLDDFQRADVVLVSHAALSAYLKNSTVTLSKKLISSNVFTEDKYASVYNSHKTVRAELTAEEIYATCSPAVFYMEIYDQSGTLTSSGSGFFIDTNGTAVTNYHVIESAVSAKIQVSDSGEKYDVIGICDYSSTNDWAIIKVDCKNTSYLKIGSPSTAVGAATVYAIGSPLGLQNTISQGIISNPARVDGDVTYIQTSAAISSGSSGGALINKYGEVIGITSAGYRDGQNLNLALPMTYLENGKTEDYVPIGDFWESGRKQRAFDALALLITTYAEGMTEDGAYLYSNSSFIGMGMIYYDLYYYPEKEISVNIFYQANRTTVYHYAFTIAPESTSSESVYTRNIYSNGKYSEQARGSLTLDTNAFTSDGKYSFDEYSGQAREDDEKLALALHCNGLEYLQSIFNRVFYSAYSTADLGYISYN